MPARAAPPKLAPSSELLTVSGLAQLLQNIEPDSAALIERIRGWTKERLIAPSANIGSGTGKHRLYEPSVVFDIVVLNALANTGLQLAGRPYVQFALGQLQAALPGWQLARDTRRSTIPPLYLTIRHFMKRSNLGAVAAVVPKVEIDPAAESMIVINLGQLFARIGG